MWRHQVEAMISNGQCYTFFVTCTRKAKFYPINDFVNLLSTLSSWKEQDFSNFQLTGRKSRVLLSLFEVLHRKSIVKKNVKLSIHTILFGFSYRFTKFFCFLLCVCVKSVWLCCVIIPDYLKTILPPALSKFLTIIRNF